MKKILYFGLEISESWQKKQQSAKILHCPLIAIEPRSLKCTDIARAFSLLSEYTHVVMTSKVAVRLFFQGLDHYQVEVKNKTFIAVGQATARAIADYGEQAAYIALEESSEGIVLMLESLDLSHASFLWPCSTLSRNVLPLFFERKGIRFCKVPFYSTVPNKNAQIILRKHLADSDELVFTSPSSVDAYISFCKVIPRDKLITSIGPITETALIQYQNIQYH